MKFRVTPLSGLYSKIFIESFAGEITDQIAIPTIGIGSGADCDGEILVTTDLLGTSPGFVPKHVKKHWAFSEQMAAAVVQWKQGVIGAVR